MSNHPNRAHTEAPATSFEQQVAQVLDSLTKELPMSEPPAGPLDAANEYAAPSTAPDAGQRMNVLRRAFASTSPLAIALDQYRADIEAARPLAETMEGCGDAVSAAEAAFHQRAADAIPFQTVRDALAAVEWVRNDLTESSGDRPSDPDCPAIVRHRDVLLAATADLLREVASTGAGMFAVQEPAPTIIPELGITFAEAAERYRSLRRAEMEASQRGDQGAADDANRQHCRLADQIMDATPSTPADAMVILSMLADQEMGVAAGIDGERAQRALERVHALLSTAGHLLPQREKGELSSMVCRWLELRDIASPTNRQMAEHDRLSDRIAAYQPHNSVDALAHLAFVLTCYMGDSIIELRSDESVYARALQKGLAYFAGAGDPSMGMLYRLGPTDSRDEPAFWVCAEPAERVEAVEVGIEGAAEAEDDEEDELPVVDRTGSGLSKAEVRLMNVLDRMGPDDKEAMILTGRAMIAMGNVMKAAQKAAAVDQRWAEFIAKLLREDAAKLHPEGDNGLVAANGDSATADPFSDAVEDIGAQAPATLSMPLELTDRMINAGATAAGITPDQFKAAVRAAREARAA